MSSLTEKTFPIRMDRNMYERLKKQSERIGVSVTAYIRMAFTEKLEKDEITDPNRR
jgi:predicted DNA-binding protein